MLDVGGRQTEANCASNRRSIDQVGGKGVCVCGRGGGLTVKGGGQVRIVRVRSPGRGALPLSLSHCLAALSHCPCWFTAPCF